VSNITLATFPRDTDCHFQLQATSTRA
jgi:hypothetical protein